MTKEKIFELSGFSKFKISKKEYEKFLKKTKNESYICLQKTKSKEVFLELNDSKKIDNCLVYVFFVFVDEIYFKMAALDFKSSKSKEEVLALKKELLREILLKVDDIDYDMNPSADNPYGIYKFK